ncbi:putative Ig domain-containing protein [Hymenobacter sp. DH14]|uniref:Ig domain-containing protein n=1 Tax=Hymenobacter cyanobacteriorum TaxID=2926463 RepID=A0A9X2AHU1_9BACT|nr:putative Ig domain-containing protein [Hymenobacter cyanobacteriorum]MCI1186954.1 putative Ig domain-containing protein [Hymenobacter cyanobacteriorum]
MKKHLILWLLLLLSGSAWAQLNIKESFEASGSDYGYTSSFSNTTSNSVYFTRTTNPKTGFGNPVQSPTPDGSWFWAAEGVRDFNRTIPAATVTLNAIPNAGNYNNIVVKILATDPRGGTSGTATADDHLRIQYAYSPTNTVPTSSSFITAGEFKGGVNTATSLWYKFINGVNVGGPLTTSFVSYDFPIGSGTGFLFIRVEVDDNQSGTEIGFDNIRVTGDQATTVRPNLTTTDTGDRAYAEGAAALPIFSTLTADNPSGTTLGAAKVIFTNGTRVAAQDELTYTIPNGSNITFDAANSTNGALAFIGSSSETNYQNLLLSVRYRNTTSTAARGGTRSFAFTVSDGANTSVVLSRNVVVTAKLNDAVGLPFTEDFEDDGEGTTYGSNTATSGTQGFVRLTGAPGATFNSTTVFSQVQGSGYFYGKGTKEFFLPASSDGLPTAGNNIATPLGGVLQLAPVNTTGFTNLHFKLKAAATSPSPFSTDDFLRFSYNLNNGAGWQAFPSGNFTGLNNGGLRQDGSASGLLLTTTMQDVDITLPAAVAGTNVSFRVEVGDNSSEEIAFDNIQITGTPIPTTVSSIVRASTNPTNAASVQYTVTFAASVTGLTTSNFTLTTTGTLGTTPSVSSVSGSGTTYTVTVNTGTGSGTLRLDLNNSTGLTPGVSNVPYTSGEVYSIDKDGPAVTSVTVPANGTYRVGQTLSFTANFSENVTVTGTPQLALTFGATARQAAYVSGTGTAALVFSYTVQSGDQDTDGIALGALALNGGTLRDALGNNALLTLNGVPSTAGILVDGVAPTVSSSNRQSPTANPTNATSLTYRVTFSEAVTGVTTASFTFVTTTGSTTGTIASVASVSGSSGTQYDVTVTGVNGNGAVRLDVKSSGSGITDAAGNALSGGFTGGQTYTISQSVTVVSVTRLTPSPTATAQVRYQVVFSGSVAGLTPNNFTPTITSGSISGASVFSVSTTSGTTYTVTVTTGTGNGTLRLDVANSTGTTPAIANVPYTAGETYTITKSFPAGPQLVLQAGGSPSGRSDVTAFVDGVQVVQNGTSTPVANALQNGGFETNNLGGNDFLYPSTGLSAAPWAFASQSGIARIGGGGFAPASSGQPAPNSFVAFLQSSGGSSGSTTQRLAVPTGTYQVGFVAAQRGNQSGVEDQVVNVFLNDGLDNVFIGVIQPNSATTYNAFTSATFNVFAPTLTATVSGPASPTSTSPLPFSVSFTQNVGTTFTASDVTVTGGTLNTASFSGSGAGPYTFTVTPTGTGTVSVSLAANVAQDANNTNNSASNTVSVQYAQPVTAAPVIAAPANGSLTNQDVTISGTAPAGSTVLLYVSQGGTAVSGSPFTATAQTDGTFSFGPYPFTDGTYQVYATAQTAGASVSASSNTNTFTVDKTRPSVLLTSNVPSGSTNVATPFAFTATFSEGVSGFVSGDLSVTNGTVTSGPTVVTGTTPANSTYTFDVTPNTPGTVTSVFVFTNSVQDAASNGNTASNTYSLTSAAPVVTVAPASGSLTGGTVGIAYSQTITASGATAPYTYAITAGALPAGLTLSSAGVLSGTPTAGGSFTFTVRATDASATPGPFSGSRSYTLVIAAPIIVVSPTTLPTGTAGAAYSQTLTASGGTAPYSFSIIGGALPSGLTLAGNGTLSGTPTASGTFSFTAAATDASTGGGPYLGSRTYSLTINNQPATAAPVITSPANNSFTNQGVTISGTAPANSQVVLYSSQNGGAFQPASPITATAGGSFSVGPVPFPDAVYQVYATAQNPNSSVSANSPTITFTVDTQVPMVSISSSAGTSGGSTGTTPIPFSVTFSETVNGSFVQGDLSVTGGSIVAGSFSGSGAGPYTFSVTPSGIGSTVTVNVPANVAQDAAGNFNTAAPAAYTLRYAPALTATVSTTSASPTSTSPIPFSVSFSQSVGTSFVATDVSVTGGAVTTGSFSGSGAGPYTFTVTPTTTGTVTVSLAANVAQDAATTGNTASNSVSVQFQAPTITVAPASLPGGTVGVAYSATLTASGSSGTYTYNITGTLPSGLTLTGSTISGTPTASGSFSFTVTATDNSAAPGPYSGSRTYTVAITAPTITLAPTTLPNGTQGVAYSQALTASGGTGAYTYAITAGALPSGLTLTGGTISGTPTVNGTFNFTVTATDAFGSTGSQAYTLVIAAPVVTAVTWTGALNTDWFTAGNWTSNTVPTATINATIPTSPSGGRFPAITSSTANVRNLTLNSGATLTQVGGTLNIAAILTNNGTYSASNPSSSGTGPVLSLGGTAFSNIVGSSTTRFWNLTVGANGALLATSAGAAVQRVLTLDGNFSTNGNSFTLESNASGTAMIVNNGSNVVNGTTTVQRYIAPDLNPNQGYRHVSAPISNATVASLSTGSFTPTVNPTYNTSATPTAETPFPTVYGYDQDRLATTTNNLADFDKGWFSPGSLSDALTVGKGYTVNLAANQTWNFVGAPNNGTLTQTLARNSGATNAASGLQLVGNPYPAPLDWSLVTAADRPNLDGVIYQFSSNDPTNPYTGTYGFYNAGFGTISPVVALGQGFFVRVSQGQTSGTLSLKNSHRVTTYQNPTYHRTAGTRPVVHLTLQGAGKPQTDDAFVYFEAGATNGLDAEYDGLKLANPSGLNLSSSISATERLCVNGLEPLTTTQRIVPLAVGVPAAGSYTLNAAEVLNLTTTPVYLRDKQTGAVVDLAQQPSYSFVVSNASALLTSRFELVFSPQAALATAPAALAAQVGVYPNPATTTAFVELPAVLGRVAVSTELVDALGRTVRTQSLPAQGAAAHRLDLANLATGVYTLHLNTSAGVVVKKLVVQ